MKNQSLHIEICRSCYMPNKFSIRIGNILGSSELSNVESKEILKEIIDAMYELEIRVKEKN